MENKNNKINRAQKKNITVSASCDLCLLIFRYCHNMLDYNKKKSAMKFNNNKNACMHCDYVDT